jgi:PII-like signaling protein
MLTKGPAKKVTIFINEDTQHHMTALHDSIMAFLMHKGVSGATATRAYSGFGSHQLLHTPKIEVLAQHLPIRIEFVETPEKVDEVLPTLYEMVSDGLIEVQDTTVVKLARKSAKPEPRLRTSANRDRRSSCACSWARPTSGTTRRSTTPS